MTRDHLAQMVRMGLLVPQELLALLEALGQPGQLGLPVRELPGLQDQPELPGAPGRPVQRVQRVRPELPELLVGREQQDLLGPPG